MITKQQYRRLMSEYQATGNVTESAMKADVSRPTARKYLEAGESPEELQAKRSWRTRLDPLAKIWPKAEQMLVDEPGLEAKVLFEHLWTETPWEVGEKHLRTFQRRVKQWRLQHGPDKEVFFTQDWIAGQAMQLDWTNANELGITMEDQPYPHLLCHTVLPYSNWQWATRCQSESLLSLRHGLQEGVQRLGKVPRELRVDNSSAATHHLGAGAGNERGFNPDFMSVCEHYGLAPKTIGIGCPNENGDVESSNGHLKRRLKQQLLLRGSRNFGVQSDYDTFLGKVLKVANDCRAVRLGEELAVMKPLPPTRLSEYDEVYCQVSSGSIIRVKKVGYSVPARLIGQEVKVEVHEQQLKVYSGRELLLTMPRHRGNRGMVLDYRHVIDHLLRKPGAFECYRHREELFPTPTFRQAYDRMVAIQGRRQGSLEYLRLLKLASEVGQNDLELMLVEYVCPPHPAWSVDDLRELLRPQARSQPALAALEPEWSSYDSLLKSPHQEVTHVG
jgi:transposase